MIGQTIAAWRQDRGETQEALGLALGCTKSRISEIEKGKRLPTPDQALAIELISAGRIDAGKLNPVVAASRRVLGIASRPGESSPAINDDWALNGSELAGLDDQRVILCGECELRLDQHTVLSCQASDCPHRAQITERQAA